MELLDIEAWKVAISEFSLSNQFFGNDIALITVQLLLYGPKH